MAICVLFEFLGVTQAQYDESAKRLTKGGTLRSLSDWPAKGLLSHVAGPTPNGWRVMDVWESEADFRRFGEILLPILKEIGIPDTVPQIFPAYNVVRS